jgi:hypothetical protein
MGLVTPGESVTIGAMDDPPSPAGWCSPHVWLSLTDAGNHHQATGAQVPWNSRIQTGFNVKLNENILR